MWIAALATLFLTTAAGAQSPPVGSVQVLPVITLDLRAANSDKQTKRVTYTPPPGWYIRSHQVAVAHKQGNTSYAVSTVPAGWAWSSEQRLTESYRQLLDLTARIQNLGGQGRLQNDRDAQVDDTRAAQSSHHALVVDVTATGEGVFRAASEIQLTVNAELVYVGTDLPPRFAPFTGNSNVPDTLRPAKATRTTTARLGPPTP
jgi:hypothetical protein